MSMFLKRVPDKTTNKKPTMKMNITKSLAALALLLTGLFVSACSSNTGQPGIHQMGASPMSNAKMPGQLPSGSR